MRYKELKEKISILISSGSLVERYLKIYEDNLETDDSSPVFGHSLSSYQIENVRSRLKKSKQTKSLGKYIQILAASKGHFQYDAGFFGQAQITNPTWSKLINDKRPNPERETILRIAILLKCNLEQTHELLAKAGYVASDCNNRDQLVLGCIEMGVYDFADIEELIAEEGLKSLFR
ncbi:MULTISPECIES: hypothetical protein [unclassified Paenibacillus]|uniref:hypothetical protein n=1 Tax=unclassified Paenibacillus TaxID=185978 RepID=UPI001AE86E63|nr:MULTISPECIES: hypothetical protein [unclassified Paenibacillus]MBP1153952.1 hypothetical protein [Paenibacillus sp. PvP091]MBP1170663.1 hypothetical protein [Paenibacillus sp. PvR098]MBP2441691.1 hypothetical protein [Paenibacillus sp. PvP052]